MRGAAVRVWLIQVIIALMLLGCSSPNRVPVADRYRPDNAANETAYTVRRGDTLYSIAFRYGMDYRRLARINGISSNYRIYPGQRLSLKATSKPVRQASSSKAPEKSTATHSPQTHRASKPAVHPKTQPAPAAKPSAPVKKIAKVSSPAAAIKWRWPSKGKLVDTFRTKGKVNKGINLAGRIGDPVTAAASGQVVYAGNGLLGYGNLVIIDHNQKYLSAYAHNSRVLVKERDKVQAGQKIAEMGRSGADRVMLHFEIRRDGVPVNPLRYLPKK